ncbi:unnamed protein product [Brachionus calyciflorus]|uniref:Integrase catalytic domain-containing protein n=1 Tax=Brachionus calyciflorus TaxID=104777 RepID=A0A813Y7U2_9BILA|nr:unnamed protein product [Brachionus calyciflorus]
MAQLGEAFKINIKKFDGTDFVLWKDKVLSALRATQCIEAIKEDFESDSPDKNLKDEKAKVILMTSIEDKILRRLTRKTAKEMWKGLTSRYENKNIQNIMCLRKRILNSKQEENESVEDFIDRVQNLREEIEGLGLKMTDQDISMTIMQGLVFAYDNFVQCLTINVDINDPGDIDLDEIINSLIIEEKRREEKNLDKNDNQDDKAFHLKKQKLRLIFQESERTLISIRSSDLKLWHFSLGHLSVENMKKLEAEDLDFSHISSTKEFCESSTLGKSTKLPHKVQGKTARNDNYIIFHSDLVGPMKTASIGSKFYIVTYLCSRTEYSFVYFLKQKSEQFKKFKEIKNYFELLTERKIKELRTDNGKEYLSNELKKFIKEAGIKHNTSVEYCQQMNEKAERLNRTLIEKARCMLIASNTSLSLCSAAVDTANYIRNRSPSAALNGIRLMN